MGKRQFEILDIVPGMCKRLRHEALLPFLIDFSMAHAALSGIIEIVVSKFTLFGSVEGKHKSQTHAYNKYYNQASPFHITSDEPRSWNSIYQEIGIALGYEPNIVHIPTDFICDIDPAFIEKLRGDKAEHGVFDNKKIKRYVPGFTCEKTFRTMIGETITWYRENPERQIIIQEQDRLIDRIITKWQQAD